MHNYLVTFIFTITKQKTSSFINIFVLVTQLTAVKIFFQFHWGVYVPDGSRGTRPPLALSGCLQAGTLYEPAKKTIQLYTYPGTAK